MSDSKKTVIIGATTNAGRYAYLAVERLACANIEFVPVGIKKGSVLGKPILPIREKPIIEDVHTITMNCGKLQV